MSDLAPDFHTRICRFCDQMIDPTDDGKWTDEDGMRMCLSSGTPASPHETHNDAHPYRSYKFDSELSRVLWLMSLDSGQDEELGSTQNFGWFARFNDASAILVAIDTGFVSAEVYAEGYPHPIKDLDDAWGMIEVQYDEWYDLYGSDCE